MRLFLLITLIISFTSGFSQKTELEIERLLNEQSKRALNAILLLERAEGESPKVLLYKSRHFQNLGEIEKSMILAQKGLSQKGSLLSAEFNKQLMIGHYLLGRTDSTIYYGQKLLGYTISKTEQAKANILIANAHWSLGNSTYAKEGYERALILSKETRDSNSISSSQNGLGLIYFQTENKLNEARSHFNEAVKYTPVNRPSNKANYLVNLSSVLIKQNRLDSALLILEKSEKIASTIGDKGILFSCFVNKGVILLSQNKLELSENNFKNAFTLITAVGVNPIDVESLYLSWSD
jgi:tetratricopeptide (TPR) repeat protein